MSFFNEFPFTRNYDADLGWLIRIVKKLMQKFDRCPTWYGEWVAEIEYPALAFVQYGTNGDTYMSIKEVPANTPITDENYWIKTGSTSEQILDLQRRMAAVESLSSSNEDRLDAADPKINFVYTKKDQIIVIGDSWADEVHDPEVALNRILKLRFKSDIYNYAYGGTGFDVPNGYDEQLTLLQNDIAAETVSVDRIRYVILICGLNDHYGGATATVFRARLQDWYEKLSAIIDPLKIPCYWFQNYSIENDVTQTNVTTLGRQRRYYEDVISLFNGRLTYVPMFGFVSSWRANERHPDAAGHVAMAENVCNILEGIPPRLYRYQRIAATINDDSLTGADKVIYIDYYVDFGAGMIECFMDVSGYALGTIQEGASVTYDHTPPVDLLTRIIADTVYLANSNYNGFTLHIGGTRAYTRQAGRYYVEVMHTFGGT